MSITEKNKTVVRTIYEQALNKRNLALLQELVAPGYIGIKGSKGAAAFEEPVATVLLALPDAQWNIETLLADGDQVFVRWKLTGTHSGPFQTLPATGNTVANDGMAVYELREGKVVASQVFTDRLNFLQQLGVLPADITVLYQKTAVKE
jgi:steroid delta-isomerase-like uncharacterized protein